MSQKSQSDGGQKHFAVGRGLLAAAETLNFNMSEQRSSRQMGGLASGVGMGGGGGGGGGSGDGKDSSAQMSRRSSGSSNNLGSTMKLFASLGLSPSDLDALAEIPEEDISVETLPQILMQLKSRKGEAGERRAASSMSSDAAYRGGREGWEEGHVGRMGGPSLGQGSARAQTSADFGFGSMQDVSSSRGYNLNYSGGGGGGGNRDRQYSELSHQDSYGGIGMGPSPSDSVFMQRRIGSPSNGKVQDFLGVMPPMFPHVCSLCDFDVHSTMEWNQHTNGLRHAENRRQLLDMYPDWDPSMAPGRGGGLLETPNLSAGLLGPSPMSSGQQGGMSSSWGGGMSGKNQSGPSKVRSRVVVVKYDRKPLSNKTLFSFTEPFGCLREHLVLKHKAFLEMSSHEEAQDMVNYYQQHPAALYGKPITFYLSQRLLVIDKDDRPSDKLLDRPLRDIKSHGSKVVFFSNLPREDEKKRELLTIAGRFGLVEKHLFLTDQAFVQLGTVEDAEMLVKYYSVNPLTIKGRPIRLNICAKYKTLNVNRRLGGDAQRRRANISSSSSSSNSRTSSSKSSSRTRDEKKKKDDDDKVKPEEKPAAAKRKKEEEEEEDEEEEEEVSGVLQGGEEGGEEEASDGDGEGEEPERAESVKEPVEESEEVKQEAPDADDITADAPGEVGGAEAQQGAESEVKMESSEIEISADEHKDEAPTEAAENSEAAEGDLPEHMFDQDFLENMEDFVTLDELGEDEDEAGESDAIDNSRRGGMRVVNIVGFRRGHNFLNELLGLAKPFGKVVKHLVLDLRPEAFLQFSSEEEARAMAKFYNGNVVASVCGRPVRVSHSMSYPTIQCGSSRVVYVGQIPSSKYSDDDILKLAEPHGKVRKYFVNRIRRECFIEMERAEDAEQMAESYKVKPPRFNGKRLTVYVSRKYRQLKHGHRCPTAPKRLNSPQKSSQQPEEPPAKKPREETEEEEEQEEKKEEEEEEEEGKKEEQKEEKKEEEEEEKKEEEVEVKKEENVPSCEEKTEEKIPEVCDEKQKINKDDDKQEEHPEDMETSTNQNAADTKPSVATLPLPTYDPDSPIGVEHVKMGYYCRVCFLFYSNEETAKKTHCSSQMHYDKLQKYLEKEQTKSEKKKGRKTTA